MGPETDPIRRLLAGRPRPRLAEDFTAELMRRVRLSERERTRQQSVGARLALGLYWVAAIAASAWILRQGPLPAWAATVLWTAAVVLVPVGYALVLWPGTAALARRERG